MKLKLLLSYLLICFFVQKGSAQEYHHAILPIQVITVFGNSDAELLHWYPISGTTDTMQLETFKFYISGIKLLNNNKIVWEEANSFHLLDLEKETTFQINCLIPSDLFFDAIKFNIGIDSITNISGALGGDLDPTLGMYWTWQNGYINFKVEGKSNNCAARNHAFLFHIGGYSGPYNTIQSVLLPLKQTEPIIIIADVGKFLSGINLATTFDVVEPGRDALQLSKKFANIFSIR